MCGCAQRWKLGLINKRWLSHDHGQKTLLAAPFHGSDPNNSVGPKHYDDVIRMLRSVGGNRLRVSWIETNCTNS
jgi:hypothetical protein